MLIISSLAVAVVLAIGGVLLLALLRAELIDTADDAGADTAISVADARPGGHPAPGARGDRGGRRRRPGRARTAQVISATTNAVGSAALPAWSSWSPASVTVLDRETLPFDEDGPFRVVALGTETPTGEVTIFVAVDVEDVDEVMDGGGRDRAVVGLAVLVVVLAAVLWGVIGRTLAPVTAIRERADAITGSELHQRVPEPVGRRRDLRPRPDDQRDARAAGGQRQSAGGVRRRCGPRAAQPDRQPAGTPRDRAAGLRTGRRRSAGPRPAAGDDPDAPARRPPAPAGQERRRHDQRGERSRSTWRRSCASR